MKSLGVTLQRTILTKNCKKSLCYIQLSSPIFLVLFTQDIPNKIIQLYVDYLALRLEKVKEEVSAFTVILQDFDFCCTSF